MVGEKLEDEDLSTKITSVLKESINGITFGEILEALERYDFSPSSIRRALQKLEEEKKIFTLIGDVSVQGRPKSLYMYAPNPSEKDNAKLQTKSDIDAEIERKESSSETENVLREMVKQAFGKIGGLPPEQRKKIYSETSKKLLKEDPRELLLKFASWLYNEHAELVKVYLSTSIIIEKEKTRNNIDGIERIANNVFYRWLGVQRDPNKFLEQTDSSVPFRLKYSKNSGDLSIFNESLLRQSIERSVFGNFVLERIKTESQDRPIRIGGSDASGYGIDLARYVPWNASHRYLYLITSVGVRYNLHKKTIEKDINPDPKVLAQYERKRAIEEGYLITPEMMQDEENMGGRIYEAAMDLRQYNKDYEILFNPGNTDVHFRDGRVFPVEHRFSDAINYGQHGDMVRRCLRIFANIVSMVGSEEGRVLMCGFVKRVNLDIMGPLILWYISIGSCDSEKRPILELSTEEYLHSPELYDHNQIVNSLFAALSSIIDVDYSIVTFRTVRRFQSMQEDNIMNLPPSTDRSDWENRLNKFKMDRSEDYIDDAVRDYALLCARASILSFYSSRPGTMSPENEKDVLVPRIETLIPYPFIDFSNSHKLSTKETIITKRVVSIMSDSGVLSKYPDDVNPMKDNNPKIFFAPKPVSEAHEDCKAIAKLYSGSLTSLLIREAKAYWLQMQASKVR